jgi:hypothetical protein
MLTHEAQKGYVVAARYAFDGDSAAKFAKQVEQLARASVLAYSTRNRVRQELKLRGYQLPPRVR